MRQAHKDFLAFCLQKMVKSSLLSYLKRIFFGADTKEVRVHMTFYQELQLNSAGSKTLIRITEDKK